MITEFLLLQFFKVVGFLIGILPNINVQLPSLSGLRDFIQMIYVFIPKWAFDIFLGAIVLWLPLQLIAFGVKFIYRKIPGVD